MTGISDHWLHTPHRIKMRIKKQQQNMKRKRNKDWHSNIIHGHLAERSTSNRTERWTRMHIMLNLLSVFLSRNTAERTLFVINRWNILCFKYFALLTLHAVLSSNLSSSTQQLYLTSSYFLSTHSSKTSASDIDKFAWTSIPPQLNVNLS